MDKLNTITRPNGQIHKEWNHLRISNIEYFLDQYGNKSEPYTPPFEILADLESQIKFENEPEETVSVAYKDDGDCLFDLVSITNDPQGRRIVTYQFSTYIS